MKMQITEDYRKGFSCELYKNLGRGEENAITQSELAEKLGVKPCVVKSTIKRMRDNCQDPDMFIVSGSAGYWLARDDADILRFRGMMVAQGGSRFETIKACDRVMANRDQFELDLG